jgi:hypothetical protein
MPNNSSRNGRVKRRRSPWKPPVERWYSRACAKISAARSATHVGHEETGGNRKCCNALTWEREDSQPPDLVGNRLNGHCRSVCCSALYRQPLSGVNRCNWQHRQCGDGSLRCALLSQKQRASQQCASQKRASQHPGNQQRVSPHPYE